jgi:predicted dinucleotide-binding enzyme
MHSHSCDGTAHKELIMKIGMIGSGTVGGQFGQGLVAKGHEVKFSSREPQGEKIHQLVAQAGQRASAGTAAKTIAFADLIIVAMPWDAVESTVRDAMFRDYSCVVLAACMGEPIGEGLSRSNHEASLLLIQTIFGWVSDSDELIKALEVQPIAIAQVQP